MRAVPIGQLIAVHRDHVHKTLTGLAILVRETDPLHEHPGSVPSSSPHLWCQRREFPAPGLAPPEESWTSNRLFFRPRCIASERINILEGPRVFKPLGYSKECSHCIDPKTPIGPSEQVCYRKAKTGLNYVGKCQWSYTDSELGAIAQ